MKIKHKPTKPYRAQTNGTVERMIGKIEQHVIKQNKAPSINDLVKAIANFFLFYHLTYHFFYTRDTIIKAKRMYRKQNRT